MTRRLARYADAVRHMRGQQLLMRPRRKLPLRLLAARTQVGGPVPFRPLAAGRFALSAPPSGDVPAPHETGGVFTAVGATRRLGSPGFWSDPADGLLVLFTLHGFTELARYAAGPRSPEGDAFWAAAVEDWLAACSRPVLPAWHPFPTSERLLAWCAALSSRAWPPELAERMTASMLRQARVLARCVEQDIGGNHVLRNAAALTVTGACLQDVRLRDRGVRLLGRELERQVLADGGHEERSPAYHRLLTEELGDVLAVLEAAGVTPPAALPAVHTRMVAWQRALVAPDGALPLLNDAWSGPPLPRAVDPPPLTDLAATGYVVLRAGGDQAVLDVAPLAPAHLPPHAHADALAFELWADGEHVIADPGTFAYSGPDRSRFRSTAVHATVEVDGQDQCEFWGDFRAAFLPRITREPVAHHPGGVVVVRASHDGYRRLADPVVHERAWCWLPGNGLVVVDRLRAREAHAVRTRLPLAPGSARGPDGRVGELVVRSFGGEGPGADIGAVPGERAPHFGVRRATQVLERAFTAQPGAAFGWTLLRDPAAVALVVEPGGAVRLQAGLTVLEL